MSLFDLPITKKCSKTLEIPQYRTICSKLGNTINPNNSPPPKIQTLSKVEKLGLLGA